jgi:hypothetical protein
MSDRLIGLVLLVISGVFYWQTYSFKKASFAQFEQMGPEFLPRGILIGLAIFSVILLVRGKGSLLPSWTLGSVRALFTRYREVLLSLLLFPIYALGISLVGFLYATVVYLIVMQLVLKPRWGRGLIITVIGSVAFSWGLVALFEGYLHVMLPSGTLF